VADFGIARAVDAVGGDRLTETGLSIGTPTYMSPEQAAGERDLDGRADLYSLGCVLYEMLAGQPPFTGPSVESVVHQHLTANAPPITQLRPAVPAEVAAAVQRALAKTPADRFNPVAQFTEALRPAAFVRPLCERAAVWSRLEGAPAEWERALHDLRQARAIDPLNAWAVAMHSMCLGFMGRFEDSLEAARAAVALDAENFTARWTLVNALVDLGRQEEALREAEPGLMMSGRHPLILCVVAAAHAARGDREAADAVYQEIASRAHTGYVGWTEQGAAAAAAGRLDEARELVALGVQAREPLLVFSKMAAWAPFRADPEGIRILRSTGLPTPRPPHMTGDWPARLPGL